MSYRYLLLIQEERETAVSDLRNSDRKQHIHTLSSAIQQYIVDHNGKLPGDFSEDEKYICRTDIESDCTGLIDLSDLTEDYLVTLPIDPLIISGSSIGYIIQKEQNSIIIKAPKAEYEEISISFRL